MKPEKLKPKFDLEAIAENYGFKYLNFENGEPQPTKTEWQQFYSSLNSNSLKQGENNFRLNENVQVYIAIAAEGIDVSYKTKYTASEFLWNREALSNVWSCNHRKVAPKLRRQGIGSHLLNISEKLIQNVANKDSREQFCCLNVAQIDVWSFLLSNGYLADDAVRFDNLLLELQNGSSDFRIDSKGYVERISDDEIMRFVFKKIISPKSSITETADKFRQRTKKIPE